MRLCTHCGTRLQEGAGVAVCADPLCLLFAVDQGSDRLAPAPHDEVALALQHWDGRGQD